MKAWLPHILLVLGILACCAVSYFIGYDKGFRHAEQPVKEVRDTIVQRCTVTVDRPVEQIRYKDKIVFVPVPELDTITLHDTTYIALQSEKKIYEDKDYRAVVSGIHPVLEQIQVFPETVAVTRTMTVRRQWGFSVTAGPGVVWDGSFHGGVGLVAGFSYNF